MQLAAKGIMIICDGMADRPNLNYGNQTPLEVAETPNMDKLAKQGATGFMDIISPGVPPGSDVAHLSLLDTIHMSIIRAEVGLKLLELE